MKDVRKFINYLCFITILSFFACNKKDTTSINVVVSDENVILNPGGYSPLTASISFKTSVGVKLSIHVIGKHGGTTDIIKDLTTINTIHNIPIYGLYADYDNTVELIFKTESNAEISHRSYKIKTEPLPSNVYPIITIDKRTEQMIDGMTLVSYYGFDVDRLPQNPFIFDSYGDIRWYLTLKTHPQLNMLLFENGIERLQNGNFYFGDSSTDTIYEMDMFGIVINSWTMPGYHFHHNVQEKPNGNFIVSVDKIGATTIEDFIIEIDRSSKQIINVWDLNQSLQNNRRTLFNNEIGRAHV